MSFFQNERRIELVTGAELTAALPYIKYLAPSVVKALEKSLGWSADLIREKFNTTFQHHLEISKRRCSYVRTINNPDQPTKLDDVYVNLYLTSASRSFRDEDLLDSLDSDGRLIIIGTAGAGKSMLMRFLVSQALQTDYRQVPLFIDLRDLPDPKEVSFLDGLFLLTTPQEQRDHKVIFEKALANDGFCLFLDGLDEVPPDYRQELRRQIEDATIRFPKLRLIISTRPDVDLGGWEEFRGLHITPLNLNQSKRLIEKIDFDNELKSQFISKLESEEFNQYHTFLEIPLLNIILLMCFGEYLELSEKSSSFYDQAFEVLYRRHDRVKGLRRKHYTSLAADDFRALLYAFCYRSLVDHVTSFTEEEMSTYIRKASTITEIDVDATALAQDFTESVSLMHRDGLKIYFIHRTFQEYFSAKFMSLYSGAEAYEVYDALLSFNSNTLIAKMASDIDRGRLESRWVLKSIEVLETALDHQNSTLKLDRFIADFSIRYLNGGFSINGYGWNATFLSDRLMALSAIYPTEFKSNGMIMNVTEGVFYAPLLLDGQPLNLAAKRTDISLAEDFKEFLTREGYTETDTFAFDTQTHDWKWILQTQLGSQFQTVYRDIMRVKQNVTVRVSERAARSVFD